MIEILDILLVYVLIGLMFQYSSTGQQILFYYMPHLILGLIYIFLRLTKTKETEKYFVFTPQKNELSEGIWGAIVGFMSIMLVSIFVPYIIYLQIFTYSELQQLPDMIIFVFFQSAMEELLYRGVMPIIFSSFSYPIFKKFEDVVNPRAVSIVFGHVVSSAIFGLRHFYAYSSIYGEVLAVFYCIVAMIVGMILSFIAVKYGLWASINAHRFYNLLIVVLSCT